MQTCNKTWKPKLEIIRQLKKKWKGEFLYCEIVPGKGRQKQTKEKRQDKVIENKTP